MAIRLATQRWEYILVDDRASDKPAVFVIRELAAGERSELTLLYGQLSLAKDDDTHALIKQMDDIRRRVCDLGITEVRNVLDAEGKPLELNPREVLDMLRDKAVITELSDAVLERNRIDEDDEKK